MAVKIENGKIRLQSLEFFVTDRCNLRCLQCSASSPFLRDPNLADLDLFRASLASLSRVMVCDQIKFLGGEPLLNKELCRFLAAARESGMFGRLRVTTNGVLLGRMDEEFWRLADVVEVSLYPGAKGVPSADELAALRRRAAACGTAFEVNPIHRFMVAISDCRIEDAELVGRIFGSCGEAHEWSCHLLYRDRLYRCSRVHTLDRYLGELGVPHDPFTALDGLPVLGGDAARLAAEVRDYLTSETPLHACSFCLGTAGRWVGCRQLDRDEIAAKRRGERSPFSPALLVSPMEASMRNAVVTWAEAGERDLL